jgi:hypothetical protein
MSLRKNYYNSKVIAAVYEFHDNRVYPTKGDEK